LLEQLEMKTRWPITQLPKMNRVPLHIPRATGLTLLLSALAPIAPSTAADPTKPVRIIQITKENADRSAAEISASKSPLIGEPPPGKIVPAPSDWRNSRAQSLENEEASAPLNNSTDGAPATSSDQAVVQVIRPGETGFVVETQVLPRRN
jgi:hypothetical protein